MDWEGKVGAPSGRCALSGRPLRAGEVVYSVLVQRDGQWQRLDIAAEAWPHYERHEVLSWWRRTVPPAPPPPPRLRLDADALERIVDDLAERPDDDCLALRYVAALCLVRCRRWSLLGSEREAEGRWLRLRTREGRELRLREPALAAEQEARLTAQLLAIAEGGPTSSETTL
ncbi:MAG: hypothetical protein RMM29_04685 [Planctomycetota bacterium]|nr:hypothetical protein [Planctomycetota bacterium]MCX8039629.1 hypothetical protein [Planctomycetota bacterium]MDW8372932.1 hypothetical protein [Planctomycetota bacterium]